MMAPLNFSTPAAKPKIGFSIDSIVGDDSPADGGKPARVSAASRVSPSPRSPRSPDGSPRCSPVSAAGWSPAGRARSPLRSRSPVLPRAAAAGRPRSPPPLDMEQAKLAAFHHLHSMQQLHSLQHRLHAPEPLHPAALRTPVPGLPGFGLGPLGLARPAVSVASGQPLPPAFGPPHLGGGLPPQTEYPLLPWLYSRQGRLFPSRFPGPEFPAFLLQPFRKPKRIRTAFSPSQLLKLEHAFENNHYVVGQERKQLAQALNLSETQVKVWFQNRRTKHKRVQDEEGGPTKSPGAAPAAADAADEQTDSLLTYEESDEENIDVDAADKPEEP